MRIAWLINLYPPYVVGGNEMLAHDIVEALRQRGHDVHVLTAEGRDFETGHVHQVLGYRLEDKTDLFLGGKRFSISDAVRHHVFDGRTYFNVLHTLRQLRPELVVVDNLYMASTAPLLAARSAVRCPIVAQVADKWLRYLLWDLTLLLHPGSRWQQTMLHLYSRWAQPLLRRLGQPDEIASISSFIRQQYVEAGFPAGRIRTMHLGVDTALYQPRQEPHVRDNGLEVVFAGQLWEGKGPQVVVDALGRLRQREPTLELHLRMVGTGNEQFRQYLVEEIRRHGMEDRTTLDGFVPLAALAECLRSGDIFVFPSVWDEPFSITLVAAMASGIPVIAARTGGTPEAFRDGVEGILVPPRDADALANAVLQLARDPGLRQKLAQAAVRKAQQDWSFRAYVDRLEHYYLEIARKGRA
jgi:glycosyltransferase involved in cell wall biosynthesis